MIIQRQKNEMFQTHFLILNALDYLLPYFITPLSKLVFCSLHTELQMSYKRSLSSLVQIIAHALTFESTSVY